MENKRTQTKEICRGGSDCLPFRQRKFGLMRLEKCVDLTVLDSLPVHPLERPFYYSLFKGSLCHRLFVI